MIRRLATTWMVATALLGAPAVHAQSTIELRSNAHVAPGSPVTLGQIARLDGADAVALAGIEVARPSGKTLSIDDVRRALDAGGRINWGRITLRGATCTLLGLEPKPARPEPVPKAEAVGPNTVRAAVAIQLPRVLKVSTDDLQLEFAPADAEFLNTATVGRTVEIHPTAMADRMPLRIAIYERDRMIGPERTIRVGVRIKRDVLVGVAAKRRGEAISPEDYTIESRWISPTARPASRDQLAGAAVKGRVNPGEVIEVDDVVPAITVNKGEIVAVRCVSGGIVLCTRARALTPGHDGDLIEFQALDSKRRFFARMDGRGRAIVSADPGPRDPTNPPANPDNPNPLRPLPVRGDRIPPPNSLEASR